MADGTDRHPLFTGHLFRTGCVCPTKLYYKQESRFPEHRVDAPFFYHLRYNRAQLRQLVRRLYPEGQQVTRDDRTEAALETRTLIDRRPVTLFDAAFIHDSLYARVPVLQLGDRGKAEILHIQTKAFRPGSDRIVKSSGAIIARWRPYLIDMAFRLHVIQCAYPDWELSASLVVPNRRAEVTVDGLDHQLRDIPENAPIDPAEVIRDNRDLVVKLPVMDAIQRIWEGGEIISEDERLKEMPFDQLVGELSDIYRSGKKYSATVGMKCRSCEFRTRDRELGENQRSGFRECWEQVEDYDEDKGHVFDLIGHGTRRLMNNEQFNPENVSTEPGFQLQQLVGEAGTISIQQRRNLQILKARNEELPEEIIKPRLLREIDGWAYPIHFLDFEAGNFAIPIKSNRSPYQQVVFQFSCHTLRADGSLAHHDWIEESQTGYPNYDLVRKLMEVPEITEGTLVQYSGFEREALKRIRRELMEDESPAADEEELTSWLQEIIERDDSNGDRKPYLADLSRLVRDYYYNSRMEDSLSIKEVLQAIMGHSSILRERFSEPYEGSHFNGIRWWQESAYSEGVINPYELLRRTGSHEVNRGADAMAAFGRLRQDGMTDRDREELIHSLQQYCELDTLAMVMIFLHWKEQLPVRRNK